MTAGDVISISTTDTAQFAFAIKSIAFAATDATAVPQPATLAMFAAGLAGIGLVRRRA